MPDAIVKALATITEPDTTETDDAPYGGFTAVLSTPTMDRDDDELMRDEWIEPLPKSIPIDIDHQMSVEGTVGSGRPYFDDGGRLMLDARFASTEKAQNVRSLVKDGHIGTVSVAFLNRRGTEKGAKPRRELLNAGIVAVPANPEAVILSSKALDLVEAHAKAAADSADEKASDKPKPPYGNVRYADPGYLDRDGKPAEDGKGLPRYPIDTEAHARAALSYFAQERNRSQYTPDQQKSIDGRIKAACEKFDIKVDDDDKQKQFDRITVLTDAGLTFSEVRKALELGDVDSAEFLVPKGLSSPEIEAKAGARNSASDSQMIQAIHDASSLLGADCVSESAPDVSDGSSEGANKSVHAFVVGKSMVGSVEDMQCRLQCALNDATGAGDWGGGYACIVATYMNPDGKGGSVVYRLGGETLCRAFSDDGADVQLDPNIQAVTLVTSAVAIPDTVDGDPTPLPPAAADAAKSITLEDFKAALDALTKTSGAIPGSPESPATESVSPDSKAAPKGSADDDESADDDDDEAAEDDKEDDDDEDEKAKALRARLMIANAQMALAS